MKTTYKYKDFTYIMDYEKRCYEVESPLEQPTSVFKYYANSEYSIDALMNNYLFCSHPFHLNDSMDSSDLLIDFSEINENDYYGFWKHIGLLEKVKPDYYEDKANRFRLFKEYFHYYSTQGMGIISLTSNPLHTLMWSHYATEKGFSIELDTDKLITNLYKENNELRNHAFFPIQYVDKLESIGCFNKSFKTPDLPLLYSTAIKRREWEYENEWRLLSFSENYGIPLSLIYPKKDMPFINERKVFYSKESINSIILGKFYINGTNVIEHIDLDTFRIKQDDALFLNYIYDNYNDRLYQSGQYEQGKAYSRSAQRIELEKIEENVFKFHFFEEGFFEERV